MLNKEDFCKVMVDLGFIHSQKLSLRYQIEFALKLPMLGLLWEVLSKN